MELRTGIVLGLLVGASACSGGGSGALTDPDAPLVVAARTSVLQTGKTGSAVAAPPSVRVTRSGAGVAGIAVNFTVTAGDGLVEGSSQTTDAAGIATLGSWKLGRIGANRVTAAAAGAQGSPVLFEATADPGPSMQARFYFADSVNVGTSAAPQWVAAGIRGDGRSRDGQAATSSRPGGEYQGRFCGVNAVLGRGAEYGENDGLNFHVSRFWADTLPSSCQPARAYRFFLDGPGAPPLLLHPLSIVEGLGSMAVGETRIQTHLVFQTGAAEVGGIRFTDDAPYGTSAAQITRLPDTRDELDRPVRQWRVESRNTHKAYNLADFRVTYYLPFSLTVIEAPYPFATYP